MKRLLRLCPLLLAFCLVPSVASAQLPQYRVGQPSMGENYHFEFSYGYWNPTPEITIASDRLTMIGTDIDVVKDLGVTKTRLPEFRFIVRPAKKHKVRFEYLSIKYQSEATLSRTITFRGVSYTLGLPVTSEIDWKAYRFGYEYDIVYRPRGFFGIIAEVKHSDIKASIASPLESASAHERAPVPAIGAIARGYVARNVSLTGEFTAFKLPSSVSEGRVARYVDFDVYATINFSNNVGVQGGYRSLDAMYQVDEDSGDLTLRGVYFRGVLRF